MPNITSRYQYDSVCDFFGGCKMQWTGTSLGKLVDWGMISKTDSCILSPYCRPQIEMVFFWNLGPILNTLCPILNTLCPNFFRGHNLENKTVLSIPSSDQARWEAGTLAAADHLDHIFGIPGPIIVGSSGFEFEEHYIMILSYESWFA